MGRRIRILHLLDRDDVAAIGSLVSSAASGCDCHAVSSFDELDARLESESWDLVVCDYQLSGGEALSALNLLHRHGLDLPLILTGDISTDQASEALYAGVADVVSRSRLDRLPMVIQRLCRRLRSGDDSDYLRELTEHIHKVFWLVDTVHRRLVYLSPAYERIWERPARDLLNNLDSLLETVHPEDYAEVHQCLEQQGWGGFNLDYRILLPDGTVRWVATRSYPVFDEQGRVYRVAGVSRDITRRKQLESEMRTLSRAVEQTADAVMITNTRGLIEYVNPAFEEVSGYSREELIGKSPSVFKSGFQDERFYAHMWQCLRNGISYSDIFINRRKDGELYYEAKTVTPVRSDNGEITHFVSTGKDVTRRLKAQERLHNLFHYDAVTGLANRILVRERLERATLQARRQGQLVGVLCINFDLESILDEGVNKEDAEKLLREVARRLRGGLDQEATVGHLEREHFVVLHQSAEGSRSIESLARRLIATFAEPLRADGYELYLSPSIGISIYPNDTEEVDTLLRDAELAMEAARGSGCNEYRFFRTPDKPEPIPASRH